MSMSSLAPPRTNFLEPTRSYGSLPARPGNSSLLSTPVANTSPTRTFQPSVALNPSRLKPTTPMLTEDDSQPDYYSWLDDPEPPLPLSPKANRSPKQPPVSLSHCNQITINIYGNN
eukprot:TRINITY_DN1946_c0_g1_i1.p1 TRINITY_DN1946_c0_g1~~TRINITY_DN1946_c0_g1_i1.p1  ORF type:complete len:116 (-),score=20.43 TRINITY_DN1946_c0_g1_i1:65-412(-)